MGHRFNRFLSRLQHHLLDAAFRLNCETWGIAVRRWLPWTWPFLITAALLLGYGRAGPEIAFAATGAAILVLLVGVLPWLACLIVLTIQGALNWRAKRAQRAAHRPPRLADGSVDWAAIDNYVLLSEAAWYDVPKTLEAMMAGPMNRFIQMAEDRSVPIRGRAREMEFARIVPEAFKRRRARTAAAAEAVDAAVIAELERRLADQGSDGRYLIDVYLGKRTHNG